MCLRRGPLSKKPGQCERKRNRTGERESCDFNQRPRQEVLVSRYQPGLVWGHSCTVLAAASALPCQLVEPGYLLLPMYKGTPALVEPHGPRIPGQCPGSRPQRVSLQGRGVDRHALQSRSGLRGLPHKHEAYSTREEGRRSLTSQDISHHRSIRLTPLQAGLEPKQLPRAAHTAGVTAWTLAHAGRPLSERVLCAAPSLMPFMLLLAAAPRSCWVSGSSCIPKLKSVRPAEMLAGGDGGQQGNAGGGARCRAEL